MASARRTDPLLQTSGLAGRQRSPVGLPRPDSGLLRALLDPSLRLAERAFGLDEIERMAAEVERGDAQDSTADERTRQLRLMARILAATGIEPFAPEHEVARVPQSGAALVCSNHPFGGADSTALLALLLGRRADVRFLTNAMLARFPFLGPLCIYVDPFGGADAARRNARALREALGWMRGGGLLVAFPAGEVSSVRWGSWTPADPPWSLIPARLARSAGARIVPAWCDGANSRTFQLAGLLHPRLRTALLPNEFIARRGQRVSYRFGRPLESDACGDDVESLTRLVRGRAELLRSEERPRREAPGHAPVAAPESTGDELAAELAALPPGARLVAEGSYMVYEVPPPRAAGRTPKLMREIGRLREIAFRAVGEGSGRPIDVDRFDETYAQLVLWNAERREVVGGYRVGVVGELVRREGLAGLYTSTLFEFSPRLVAELGDAVELGRSYVRSEYQRQALPLSLLWRGIAHFLLRHGCRRMFGPVSISNDYRSMSKELIIAFLERHRLAVPFAPLARPRHPPVRRPACAWGAREEGVAAPDVAHLERLVEEIERGERAVPVLLRQYLRLNARLLAFNVDPDFGDVVDALMLVDIAQIDARIVRHYLGDDGLALVEARYGSGGSGGSPATGS